MQRALAGSRALRATGSLRSADRPTPPRTSSPRSSNIRTVSTAYSGTPSARARICSRRSSGRPGTNPSSSSVIADSESGPRWSDVKLRCPAPQFGRLSSSSGRVRTSTKSGLDFRPLEQVLDEVEQARVRPLHVLEHEDGRIRIGEPLEEEPPGCEQVVALVRGLLLGDTEQAREQRLDEFPLVLSRMCSVSVASSFERAVASSSSSEMRARMRTMSASAQYVTPSPYARQRPRCQYTLSTRPSKYL